MFVFSQTIWRPVPVSHARHVCPEATAGPAARLPRPLWPLLLLILGCAAVPATGFLFPPPGPPSSGRPLPPPAPGRCPRAVSRAGYCAHASPHSRACPSPTRLGFPWHKHLPTPPAPLAHYRLAAARACLPLTTGRAGPGLPPVVLVTHLQQMHGWLAPNRSARAR